MDKNELAKRLMATFLDELRDHVEALNRNLLALEKNPPEKEREQLLKDLLRSAHSLKGAARAVNIDLIEQACHKLEDILAAARDGKMNITGELFPVFFSAADAIEEAGMRLREDQSLDEAPLQDLLPALEKAAAGDFALAQLTGTTHVERSSVEQEPGESSSEHPVEPLPVKENAVAESADVATPGPISGQSIRVAAEKLDSLLAQTGELLVARRRVEYRSQDVATLRETIGAVWSEWRELEKPLRQLLDSPASETRKATLPKRATSVLQRTGQRLAQLEKDAEQLIKNMTLDARMLGQTCDALDDEVHWVRMLPFAHACGGLERTVRDIARSTGKKVELEFEGADVEVDRSVLEGLKDPLLHLVRNAVDHGVEGPDERLANGKDVTARITVSAQLRGGQVEVVVADDGRGFNLEQIQERVRKRGLPEPQDDRELARMVFLPGFSTAQIVTDVSGRGVGLDVVESQIQSLHGSVDVSFQAGVGTSFTMTVPLTLTTIRCLLCTSGEQTFAFPTGNVRQIVRFDPADLRLLGGREMLMWGKRPIPLGLLAATLGQEAATKRRAGDKQLAIVLTAGGMEVALVVDEVTAEQDILVKNLGTRVRRMRHVSGATLLPSGKVALVLNAGNIVRSALDRPLLGSFAVQNDSEDPEKRNRLLIVEDSVTTRTLMKSILEASGYEVATAVDGKQGLELLERSEVDLVVSDVDMPRLDGFELTAAIRSSERLQHLPVVLVTARETDKDKARGVQVGANAYLVKRSFDQRNLLKTIEQLV